MAAVHSAFDDIRKLISLLLEYPISSPSAYPHIPPSSFSPTPLIKHIERIANIKIPLVRHGSLGETPEGIQWNWKVLSGWWAWEAQVGLPTQTLRSSQILDSTTYQEALDPSVEVEMRVEDAEWFKNVDEKVRALDDMVKQARIWLEDKDSIENDNDNELAFEELKNATPYRGMEGIQPHQVNTQQEAISNANTPRPQSQQVPLVSTPPTVSSQESQRTLVEPSIQEVVTPNLNVRPPPTLTPPTTNSATRQRPAMEEPSFQDVVTPIPPHMPPPPAPTPPATNVGNSLQQPLDVASFMDFVTPIPYSQPSLAPTPIAILSNPQRQTLYEPSFRGVGAPPSPLPPPALAPAALTSSATNPSPKQQKVKEPPAPQSDAGNSDCSSVVTLTEELHGHSSYFRPDNNWQMANESRGEDWDINSDVEMADFQELPVRRRGEGVEYSRWMNITIPDDATSELELEVETLSIDSVCQSPKARNSTPSENRSLPKTHNVTQRYEQPLQPLCSSTPAKPVFGACNNPSFRSSPPLVNSAPPSHHTDSPEYSSPSRTGVLQPPPPAPSPPKSHFIEESFLDLDSFPTLPSPEHLPVRRPSHDDEELLRGISLLESPVAEQYDGYPQQGPPVGMLSVIEEVDEPTDSFLERRLRRTPKSQKNTPRSHRSIKSSSPTKSPASPTLNPNGTGSANCSKILPSPSMQSSGRRERSSSTAGLEDASNDMFQGSITPPTPTPSRIVPFRKRKMLKMQVAPTLDPNATGPRTDHAPSSSTAVAAHLESRNDDFEDLWEEQALSLSPTAGKLDFSQVMAHSTPKVEQQSPVKRQGPASKSQQKDRRRNSPVGKDTSH